MEDDTTTVADPAPAGAKRSTDDTGGSQASTPPAPTTPTPVARIGGWVRPLLASRVSDGALRAFLGLLDFRGRNPNAWPKLATLAKAIGCCPRAARYRVRELVKAGLVTVRRRVGRASVYTIVDDHRLLNPALREQEPHLVGVQPEGDDVKVPSKEEIASAAKARAVTTMKKNEQRRSASRTTKPTSTSERAEHAKFVRGVEEQAQVTASRWRADRTASTANARSDLGRLEQVWRSAMAGPYPNVPLAKSAWTTANGEGRNVQKLIDDYSVERVEKYLPWIIAHWPSLTRRYEKRKNFPAIPQTIWALWLANELMGEALGVAGAITQRQKTQTVYDEAEAWRRAHPDEVTLPPELAHRVARAPKIGGKL